MRHSLLNFLACPETKSELACVVTREAAYRMGPYQLPVGTVQFPAQATPGRSSVNRVLENGMHSFEGGSRDELANASTAL
jgi:uncharacterized protein YbaR (Trm112 family)